MTISKRNWILRDVLHSLPQVFESYDGRFKFDSELHKENNDHNATKKEPYVGDYKDDINVYKYTFGGRSPNEHSLPLHGGRFEVVILCKVQHIRSFLLLVFKAASDECLASNTHLT